ESGTGISQVVAILYVAITAKTPRVIVVDEPNSFLHPGAAKKLIDILKGYRHQYIFTTHSADIIRTVAPDLLHLVRWNGASSTIEALEAEARTDQERLLAELGVRLSDIFGSESVLWVEGPTEELCFPLLLKHLGIALSAATAIVAVRST